MLSLLLAVLVAALVFDFINGFHDAANAIATSVSTGAMPIRVAVLVAAFFNFFGAMTGVKVAETISRDFVDPQFATLMVLLATLVGASVWNIITWWRGIPSSSSHALIGALAGAVVAHAGVGAFQWRALTDKVLLPLVAAPLMGFIAAFILMVAFLWIFQRARPGTVQRRARYLQIGSACGMAFAHGSNDAQKVMGIMMLALLVGMAGGATEGLPVWVLPGDDGAIPPWVIYSCAGAISFGTAFGGQRIIKTMSSKIIRLVPIQGLAAESASTATILSASALGVPVSTTHCINAAIMGVGATKRLSAVRWGVAGSMMVAWVLTLPIAAALAYLCYHLLGALLA